MDFVTSGAFLGISAIIVAILLISLLRKPSVFFTLVATVGAVALAVVVIVTFAAVAGVDRFALDFSNPPV